MVRLVTVLLAPLLLLFSQTASACPDVLNHRLTNLEGEMLDLCTFTGKVVLAVNTASYCGNTPQYEGLQALYRKYRDRGLVVVGFPANDFGHQEPGSNDEIRDFCEVTYGVEFPMAGKSSVVPGKANPVFAELARMTGKTPEWNFHKYLISRDGSRAFSYPARMQPQNRQIVSRIEALLAE
ncbi:MAG: glutathione peroxidase [Burkholderiales bacterium]